MFPFLSFSLQCHSSVRVLMPSIFNPHFSLLLQSLFCITNTRIHYSSYRNKGEFFFLKIQFYSTIIFHAFSLIVYGLNCFTSVICTYVLYVKNSLLYKSILYLPFRFWFAQNGFIIDVLNDFQSSRIKHGLLQREFKYCNAIVLNDVNNFKIVL